MVHGEIEYVMLRVARERAVRDEGCTDASGKVTRVLVRQRGVDRTTTALHQGTDGRRRHECDLRHIRQLGVDHLGKAVGQPRRR